MVHQILSHFYLDNSSVGQFSTIYTYGGDGHLWNAFKLSGPVGSMQLISPGDHWLTLIVSSTDDDGVELDEMNVSFTMCAGDCPVAQPVNQQVDQPVNNENCHSDFTLEMENALSSTPLKPCNDVYAQTPCIQFRSEASNEQTVHLSSNGQYVSYNITSFSQCFFHIIGLLFSNDGDPDIIGTYLDNDKFGEFTTPANSGGGHLWNTFENSGLVGSTQTLVPGEHRLTIRISSTDEHGVELDSLKISFTMCEGDCPVIAPFHRPDDDKNVKSNERANNESRDEDTEDDSSLTAIGIILGSVVVVLVIVAIVGVVYFINRRYRYNNY